jgi:hypothetical protein
MSSQRPVVPKPIIQHDVMPVIVARRRCEIVERRVSLSNALVASQNTSTGALPRFSPVQADRRRSGVTEKYCQAQGSGSGA